MIDFSIKASAIALFSIAMLAAPTMLAQSPSTTTAAAEPEIVKSAAISSADAAVAEIVETRKKLGSALDASEAANKAAKAFLAQATIPIPSGQMQIAPEKPLDVTPGPDDTVIHCDGGVYFNADEGVLVYLKNVTVNDPKFSLSGANELKVFFEKKSQDAPKKVKAPETPETSAGLGAVGKNFNGVDRIVATGAVKILQKQPEKGKAPVEASGAIFTYFVKTGEIIITGGYPWVKQGDSFLRAREPNLNLRIHKSGSFVTEGNWDMGGKLNQKN